MRSSCPRRLLPTAACLSTLLFVTASCGGLDAGGTPESLPAGGVVGFGGSTSGTPTAGGTAGSNSGGSTSPFPFGSGGASIIAAGGSPAGGSSARGTNASVGGASSTVGTAPTWSSIYAQFFAPGTSGNCSRCHGFGGSAENLYAELQAVGQIDGTASPLSVNGASILTWFGGIMPEGGSRTNAAASAAITAWVAAGALNN